LETLEGELHAAARLELLAEVEGQSKPDGSLAETAVSPHWRPREPQEYLALRDAMQALDPSVPLTTDIELVGLDGDLAAVRVNLRATDRTQLYRQTRFYQRTGQGWLPTAPAERLWGAPQQLETAFFVFHFRREDAEAIAEAAEQIDALYNTMRRNFGLANVPNAEKLVVNVSVMQAPGSVVERPSPDAPFLVASPALYLAPAKWSDAELLIQSIALPLIDHVLAEAVNHYGVGWRWQPLLRGLRLWQLWDLDLSLSTWRDPIVHWLYGNADGAQGAEPAVLPDQYALLCAEHNLWIRSPAQLHIPLLCSAADHAQGYARGWESLVMPLRLDQIAAALPYRTDLHSMRHPSHPADTPALATLIEYAVMVYGRERLPALLAGLGEYERWDTLIPPVFGVMPNDFETRWRNYLAEHS
jgi:hypothetical protein